MQRLLPVLAALAPLAILAHAAPSVAQQKPSAAAMQVQPLKQFKDWAVGCDNARSCTALGLSPDEGVFGPYAKIGRTGAADAAPTVSFAMALKDGVQVSSPRLKITLDGNEISGLAAEPVPARVADDVVRTDLPAAQIDAFVAALRNGTRLNIQVLDGSKAAASGAISLAGSAAALLYMDDQQKRVGTVTALAHKGDAPAASTPPVPELPVVAAKQLTDVSETKPPLPAGMTRPEEGFCAGFPVIVISLPANRTLWGLCSNAAAYNFDYTFFVAGQGQPKRAVFTAPGLAQDRGSGVLTSPVLSVDRLTLSSLALGRGVGDCGVAAEWAWDGKAFRLMRATMLDSCRGVQVEDWPVLFRARRG
jgi:hypothetical protein